MILPKIKLRLLRKKYRMSQQKVADELGMSRKNYCYIEQGIAKLTVEHAQKLKELFEVDSIDELLEVSSVSEVI